MRPLIEAKRQAPQDDLMSAIVSNPELRDEEIFSMVATLFFAGRTTVTAMITMCTFALLCNPEQLEVLRRGDAAVETGVEELLRYITALTIAMTRKAHEDVEIGDVVVRAGESVTVSLAAANRDARKFPDPDVLDLARAASGHLAFGQGQHMCLGQHMARLDLQVGLPRLFARFPTLRLAVPVEEVPMAGREEPDYTAHNLPVAW